MGRSSTENDVILLGVYNPVNPAPLRTALRVAVLRIVQFLRLPFRIARLAVLVRHLARTMHVDLEGVILIPYARPWTS